MITLKTNAIRYKDKEGKMHDSDALVIDTPLPASGNGDSEEDLQNNNKYAPAIVCIAKGETIAVNDSSDYKLKNIKLYGKSTQNGTPTPTNPVPIENLENVEVKVLGKNQLDESTIKDNGSGFFYHKDNEKLFKGGQTYTLKTHGVVPNGMYVYVDGTDVFGAYNQDTLTFKFDQDTYGYVRLYWADSVPPMEDVRTQLELGTQATPYEQYTEQTLTIPYEFGKGDSVDCASGEISRVRKRRIFDGTERWYSAFGSCYETDPSSDDLKFLMETEQIPKVVLCNCFGYEKTPEPPSENHFRITVANGTAYMLFNPSTDSIPSGNVDAWKSYLAEQYANGTPVYIEYESTEVTEEDIDLALDIHTNYPTTTIISNAELEVEYVADTKRYTDKKIEDAVAELQALILER